jgi:hypothetical protein
LGYLVRCHRNSVTGIRPELVERAQNGASTGSARSEMTEAEAEAGMAEMSKVYDETGRELYMGAGDREHD